MAFDSRKALIDYPPRNKPFDNSLPLVLAHQSFKLQNMIVDIDGRVWILKWEWAGYYPHSFEYHQ